MAIAPQRLGIGIRRYFTTDDRHPYDEVTWDRRDARISNFRDGSVAFEQLHVEVGLVVMPRVGLQMRGAHAPGHAQTPRLL